MVDVSYLKVFCSVSRSIQKPLLKEKAEVLVVSIVQFVKNFLENQNLRKLLSLPQLKKLDHFQSVWKNLISLSYTQIRKINVIKRNLGIITLLVKLLLPFYQESC